MSVYVCVVIVGLLCVGFLVSLWIRDRARRQLCELADPLFRNGIASEEWISTYEILLYSSALSHRITLICKNLDALPDSIKLRYQRYRVIRSIPVVLFVLLCAIGVFGRAICR
jgi:hypothetical protein